MQNSNSIIREIASTTLHTLVDRIAVLDCFFVGEKAHSSTYEHWWRRIGLVIHLVHPTVQPISESDGTRRRFMQWVFQTDFEKEGDSSVQMWGWRWHRE